MFKKRYSIFLLFAFLASNFSIDAQEVYELEKCVEIAVKNSLAIGQSKLAISQAEISKKSATQARYPSLNASSNLNLNFGRSIDLTTNEFTTSSFLSNGINLSSGVLLYGGGRINNSIKQADIDMDAAEKDIRQSERDLALQVAVSYLNVLYADERIDIAGFQKELSESQLAQLEKFIAVGSRPKNDKLDLEAQVTLAEQAVITAENGFEVALLTLKQLMNIDPDTKMLFRTPNQEIAILSDPFALDYKEVYESALANQPGIEAASLRESSAGMGIEIAKAGMKPTLFLNGSLGTNFSNQRQRIDGFVDERVNSTVFIDGQAVTIGTDQSFPITSKNPYFNQLDENVSYGVGLSLNVPIYDNYQTKSNVERAKLNVINNQIQKEQLKQGLRTNVQNALLDARSAKKQMEASTNTLAAQKAAYENAKKKFDLGAISTYELVNIQNTYESSQIDLTIAKFDYLFKMKVLDFYQGNPITIR